MSRRLSRRNAGCRDCITVVCCALIVLAEVMTIKGGRVVSAGVELRVRQTVLPSWFRFAKVQLHYNNHASNYDLSDCFDSACVLLSAVYQVTKVLQISLVYDHTGMLIKYEIKCRSNFLFDSPFLGCASKGSDDILIGLKNNFRQCVCVTVIVTILKSHLTKLSTHVFRRETSVHQGAKSLKPFKSDSHLTYFLSDMS